MKRCYLDTSVAVHALNGTRSAVEWFDAVNASPETRLTSSRLLRTELTRVLRRDGGSVSERDVILEKVDIIPLNESILAAAEAITAHVKTLDAIHVASALALGGDVVVATHDNGLQAAVDTVGLSWIDPVSRDV